MMTKAIASFVALICIAATVAGQRIVPPKPLAPVPTKGQLAWQQLEYYAFIHFGMNTFTDIEWGLGRAPATDFAPTAFDAEQLARVVKAAGMKGIIITAKHHDGFCLWPSKTTTYTVAQSKWRNGQGDVLNELSAACKKYGLKFGVYISPWDRNHPLYGTPKYNRVYKDQWREILTNYGDLFETWLDGANDGKKRMVYDFDGFFDTIRRIQPNAVIFSDAGPNARWVGNESGRAGETNWSTRDNDGTFPGFADEKALNTGDEDGTSWIPAECDVSIRPGWFYHANEDDKVKSVSQLLDIYYTSVGRNCNLLLNIGVDRRGQVNENDERRLLEFRRALEEDFKTNLAKGSVTATNVRGKSQAYAAANAIDENTETYWSTDDNVRSASLELDLGKETEFNRFLVQEYIALGQRVKKFSVQIQVGHQWQTIADQTTIGYKRILRFPRVKTRKLRLLIEDAKACPTISDIEIFNAPGA